MDRDAYVQLIENRITGAMDAMFPHGAGQASDTTVRHWLDNVAQVAFREGQSYALTFTYLSSNL